MLFQNEVKWIGRLGNNLVQELHGPGIGAQFCPSTLLLCSHYICQNKRFQMKSSKNQFVVWVPERKWHHETQHSFGGKLIYLNSPLHFVLGFPNLLKLWNFLLLNSLLLTNLYVNFGLLNWEVLCNSSGNKVDLNKWDLFMWLLIVYLSFAFTSFENCQLFCRSLAFGNVYIEF